LSNFYFSFADIIVIVIVIEPVIAYY